MPSTHCLGLGISLVIIIGAGIGLAFTATKEVGGETIVPKSVDVNTRYFWNSSNQTDTDSLVLSSANEGIWSKVPGTLKSTYDL